MCYNIIMAAGILPPQTRELLCKGMEIVSTELLHALWRDETSNRKHGEIWGYLP